MSSRLVWSRKVGGRQEGGRVSLLLPICAKRPCAMRVVRVGETTGALEGEGGGVVRRARDGLTSGCARRSRPLVGCAGVARVAVSKRKHHPHPAKPAHVPAWGLAEAPPLLDSLYASHTPAQALLVSSSDPKATALRNSGSYDAW